MVTQSGGFETGHLLRVQSGQGEKFTTENTEITESSRDLCVLCGEGFVLREGQQEAHNDFCSFLVKFGL